MATNLQEVYDAFFIKEPGEDFLYKQDQVFQFLKTAISKSYKTVDSNLDYKLYLNSMMIIVNSTTTINGNIQLFINGVPYTINIEMTDNLIDIANKIKIAIKDYWSIELDITNSFPIIKISGQNIDYTTTKIKDVDNTCIELVISKTYDGEFINKLGQDEIELLSLYMQREYLRQKMSPILRLKILLGTKDFNKLPEKTNDYRILSQSIKLLDDEIYSFKQEFNHYKG